MKQTTHSQEKTIGEQEVKTVSKGKLNGEVAHQELPATYHIKSILPTADNSTLAGVTIIYAQPSPSGNLIWATPDTIIYDNQEYKLLINPSIRGHWYTFTIHNKPNILQASI